MSDTCCLNIKFLRKDLPAFNKVLENQIWGDEHVFWDEDNGDDVLIDATVFEANYGWYDEIRNLAVAGLTFLSNHGEGSYYGRYAYVCYKGNLAECEVDFNNNPVCIVDRMGKLNRDEYNKCINYYDIEEMCIELFEQSK